MYPLNLLPFQRNLLKKNGKFQIEVSLKPY
jgi:hypothetical protein